MLQDKGPSVDSWGSPDVAEKTWDFSQNHTCKKCGLQCSEGDNYPTTNTKQNAGFIWENDTVIENVEVRSKVTPDEDPSEIKTSEQKRMKKHTSLLVLLNRHSV